MDILPKTVMTRPSAQARRGNSTPSSILLCPVLPCPALPGLPALRPAAPTAQKHPGIKSVRWLEWLSNGDLGWVDSDKRSHARGTGSAVSGMHAGAQRAERGEGPLIGDGPALKHVLDPLRKAWRWCFSSPAPLRSGWWVPGLTFTPRNFNPEGPKGGRARHRGRWHVLDNPVRNGPLMVFSWHGSGQIPSRFSSRANERDDVEGTTHGT